jgi:DNA-3-methyladenine glycosylase II
VIRIIRSPADIEEGVVALCAADPRLDAVHRLCGLPPLRRGAGGFEALASIIVSQQVSVASADAIWSRTRAALAPFTPAVLAAAPDESFRAGGLSTPKIRTLRALSRAVLDGLDLAALETMRAEDAHAALTSVSGIGPWTADIYVLTCLGHADAFPSGDLAIQEAARLVLGLAARPRAADLLAAAEAWRPWRAVAARLLWSYYRIAKSGREGAPTLDGGRG